MKKQRWEESEKRREKKKKEYQRRERIRRQKVVPEGRKVGSLKRRVRSRLGRWEMKNCTPLWREAHFEVKMCKAYQVRSTFWSWECWECARRCGAKHISRSRINFWKLRCRKWTPPWREADFEVKMYKAHHARSPFGSWDVEKVHAVVARSTFGSEKREKTDGLGPLLEVRIWFCVAWARDSAPWKWAKREGFVAVPKTLAGVGHLKRICKDASPVAGALQETCSPEMLKVRARFPEKGCILERQIFRFAKMILRDRCSTLYDLASLFRGRRSTLNRWNAKRVRFHHD